LGLNGRVVIVSAMLLEVSLAFSGDESGVPPTIRFGKTRTERWPAWSQLRSEASTIGKFFPHSAESLRISISVCLDGVGDG
jgi:hypothetical protein